jgi:hypothetical protein
VGASAAVVCLGGVLAACGSGGGGGGYVAVGAAGGSPGAVVAPTGEVSLIPLDEGGDGSASPEPKKTAESGGFDTAGPGISPSGRLTHSVTPSPSPSSRTGKSGRTSGGSGDTSPSPTPTASGTGAAGPTGPAALSVGDPSRRATDQRWCEKVTVSFRNTGGAAVRSGTVTLGTHIIGALGIDWATIESTEALPAPIGAGAKKDKTWTVCVDAWRVPLGMHIETRDVSVQWK